MEQEWDLKIQCPTRLLESYEFFVVEPDVVRSVFSPNQVKPYAKSELSE